jgi:hypothetical protein
MGEKLSVRPAKNRKEVIMANNLEKKAIRWEVFIPAYIIVGGAALIGY